MSHNRFVLTLSMGPNLVACCAKVSIEEEEGGLDYGNESQIVEQEHDFSMGNRREIPNDLNHQLHGYATGDGLNLAAGKRSLYFRNASG